MSFGQPVAIKPALRVQNNPVKAVASVPRFHE